MLQALCLLLQLSTIFRVVSLYHPEYATNPNLLYPLQVCRGGLVWVGGWVGQQGRPWAPVVLSCNSPVLQCLLLRPPCSLA